MKLSVSKEAAKWYMEELDLEQGDYVQFYIKLYGGIPTAHSDYYLGISVGKDGDTSYEDTVSGITFYFNNQDGWFLNEYNMKVELNGDEVEYIFTKA